MMLTAYVRISALVALPLAFAAVGCAADPVSDPSSDPETSSESSAYHSHPCKTDISVTCRVTSTNGVWSGSVSASRCGGADSVFLRLEGGGRGGSSASIGYFAKTPTTRLATLASGGVVNATYFHSLDSADEIANVQLRLVGESGGGVHLEGGLAGTTDRLGSAHISPINLQGNFACSVVRTP